MQVFLVFFIILIYLIFVFKFSKVKFNDNLILANFKLIFYFNSNTCLLSSFFVRGFIKYLKSTLYLYFVFGDIPIFNINKKFELLKQTMKKLLLKHRKVLINKNNVNKNTASWQVVNRLTLKLQHRILLADTSSLWLWTTKSRPTLKQCV